MQGSNHYFENDGGKRFVDKTAQLFPRTSWGAMGIKFFDYDNDGRPDLFITDMHSDMSVEVGPDRETLKSVMEWTKDFLQGDETKYVFGNSFFHNLGERPLRGSVRSAGRRELLAVGTERRRPQRGRLAGHLHRRVHELSMAVWHQLAAVEQPRRALPPQRVPARHRAAPRRPNAHAVVRRGLLGARDGRRSKAAGAAPAR